MLSGSFMLSSCKGDLREISSAVAASRTSEVYARANRTQASVSIDVHDRLCWCPPGAVW